MASSLQDLRDGIQVLRNTTTDLITSVNELVARLQNAEDYTAELEAVKATVAELKEADVNTENTLTSLGSAPQEPEPVVGTSTNPAPVEEAPTVEEGENGSTENS